MKWGLISIVAALAFCMLSAAAGAAGNMHIGHVKISPYISVSEAYGSNVFYTSDNEETDVVTTTTPGVMVQYPFHEHQADFEHYSKLSRYRRHTSENTTDDHTNGGAHFKFGKFVRLDLSETYAEGHESRSASSSGFIERYRTNTVSASASYQLADLSKIRIVYTKDLWRFRKSDFRNRAEDGVSGFFYYHFLPKTSVFVEYDRKRVVYSQSPVDLENTIDSVLAGLLWEMSERSQGTIKAGTIRKDFQSPVQHDFTGWTGSADVHHYFTDSTAIMVNGQRTVNETSLFGNRYFITSGVHAELTHRFVRKLSGVFRGSYSQDTYADPVPPDSTVRVDRIFFAGAGVRYAMKEWLQFSVDYTGRRRRSNIAAKKYDEHAYTASISVSL